MRLPSRGGTLLFIAFNVVGFWLGACAPDPVSTISAAAGGVETGISVFNNGKIDAAYLVPFDEACAAASRATEELAYEVIQTWRLADGSRMRLILKDETGDEVTLVVERRTETVTTVRVNVGWTGSEAVARLFLRRIDEALGLAPTLPAPDAEDEAAL